jgi:hypothetical protein
MSVAYGYLQTGDFDNSLVYYRIAADAVTALIEHNYMGDFASFSVRPISRDDRLGDDFEKRLARDEETLTYWKFESERNTNGLRSTALFELGKIHQHGLCGNDIDIPKAVWYDLRRVLPTRRFG